MKDSIIDFLLLSAGQSARFKGIKQLALHKKQTLLNHALTQIMADNHYIKNAYVVLGANHHLIQSTIEIDVNILHNKNWQQGMGNTLSFAINEIKTCSESVLICLVDQPLIPNSHYVNLCRLAYEHPTNIIATTTSKGLMAPAVFPMQYFDCLSTLEGDQGARRLLMQHINSVIAVDCEFALQDIDTQLDLVSINSNI